MRRETALGRAGSERSLSRGRCQRAPSTVVASGLFVAVVLLSGCGGPSAKSSGIRKSFEKAFPEAQFTVSCRDDLGPDSSSDYDCKVLWGPRDQKLSVRETYEWQKRLQRHDLRDYRTWHHLMPGIVSGDRIVPLSIHCQGVTERHGGYPSFDLVLAYPESGGPPGANFASTVDRQVGNFRRHHCAFSIETARTGG